MKTEDLHRHVCSITGKGMSEGFLFCDDTYIKDEENALKYAQENGYKDLPESYKEDFHYWTTWEDQEDLESEGEAYDDDGNLYEFVNGEWRLSIDLDECELIGGDGLEYELWYNKNSNEEYRVPIEIVRDLKNVKIKNLNKVI